MTEHDRFTPFSGRMLHSRSFEIVEHSWVEGGELFFADAVMAAGGIAELHDRSTAPAVRQHVKERRTIKESASYERASHSLDFEPVPVNDVCRFPLRCELAPSF